MERDNRLKRRRDIIEGDEKIRESHKDKKLESIDLQADYSCYKQDYESVDDDAFGVFDFPWLKEGALFAVDELLEPHDHVFSPCFYLQDQTKHYAYDHEPNSSVDDDHHQDSLLHQLPKIDQDYKFDDLESLDCDWSSVIHQPLDDVNICINKD